MKNAVLLDDALLLVEQNFFYLHVGEYFGRLSKEEDLSQKPLHVKRILDGKDTYNFNGDIIKEVLKDAHETPSEEITLFEYFTEFNAYRGICMAMVEALRLESPFKSFMQIRFNEQYENFYDLLSFVRNVLSHNIHAQIRLSAKDYEGTLKRIRRMKRNPEVSFDFNYARDLPEIGFPSSDYGFTYKVDFEKLQEDMPFLEIISHWELMMLSELCFNIVMSYRLFQSPQG